MTKKSLRKQLFSEAFLLFWQSAKPYVSFYA